MTDLVLADDHAVFVDALCAVLTQRGHTVSAVATGIADAVAAVRRTRPQVCLVDRHFSDGDGVDAVETLLAACPHTRLIVLTADRDTDGVFRALRSGASGYLHKGRSVDALLGTIGRVLAGEIVVDVPATAPKPERRDDAYRLAAHLTAREWECLGMLVDGMDTAAMVAALGVSRTTVRTHVQALLAKLGVHSRLEAASFAVRYRLLDDVPVAREARAI